MIALSVPSGRMRPRWYGTITCFPVESLRHFWWLPADPASAKPFRLRIEITRSAVRRGVPRSPNFYLDQLRGWWHLDLGGREVESNCFLDAQSRLIFRFTSRGAPRQLRADCGEATGFRIVLQDHSERHAWSIAPWPRGGTGRLCATGEHSVAAACSGCRMRGETEKGPRGEVPAALFFESGCVRS